MFKRLCYLIAEGFQICSISGYDGGEREDEPNARILYRIRNADGQWRLRSEEFRAGSRESAACADLFFDYLYSEGAG